IKDNWEEPANVGPFINSKRDEYYFSINAAADTLFYAANVEGNRRNMDLFSFPMPMGARPDAVYPLTGYLIDSVTKRPLTGIVVAIDLDKHVEIEPKYIGRDGYFEFFLLNNRRYQLYVLTENAIRVSEKSVFTEEALTNFFEESAEYEKPLIFESLEFMPNSAELTDDIKYHLDQIAAYLIQQPGVKLHIGGHTDSDGDPNYNLKLSQERAENIRQYLLERAELHDSVITAKGYGATMPVFPNDSKQNKARNRRVEFEIILPETELARIRAKFSDDTLTEAYAVRAGALDPDADDKDDKPELKNETETSGEIAQDAEKTAEAHAEDEDEKSAAADEAVSDADEEQKRALAELEAKKAAEEAERIKKLKEEVEEETTIEAEEAERRAKETEEAEDQ
ncbi:MAG: OmpA family protein, partial [Bacteroidia bacterium]|nr:OmpA family protein [Bacteroidia bacterium]MDW8335188.1 OmpA family protein [Bacteroidia bacterium]